MPCADPTYLPRFQRQLDPGDPYGKYNCSAYAAAMAADFDSCGVLAPTGEQVRAATNEPTPDPASPGLTLGQVDAALRAGWDIDLDTRAGSSKVSAAEFARRIDAGQGAVVQVIYEPIRTTRFRGSETFARGHAMFVPPGWGVMDPLADGRRPGIYRYQGEAYPRTLILRAAGLLAGTDFVYAAFTRDNRVAFQAIVHPTPPATTLRFGVYEVRAGAITGRVIAHTGGFSATCSAPRRYGWPGHTGRSLVRLTSGSRAGQYIRSTYAQEVP